MERLLKRNVCLIGCSLFSLPPSFLPPSSLLPPSLPHLLLVLSVIAYKLSSVHQKWHPVFQLPWSHLSPSHHIVSLSFSYFNTHFATGLYSISLSIEMTLASVSSSRPVLLLVCLAVELDQQPECTSLSVCIRSGLFSLSIEVTLASVFSSRPVF